MYRRACQVVALLVLSAGAGCYQSHGREFTGSPPGDGGSLPGDGGSLPGDGGIPPDPVTACPDPDPSRPEAHDLPPLHVSSEPIREIDLVEGAGGAWLSGIVGEITPRAMTFALMPWGAVERELLLPVEDAVEVRLSWDPDLGAGLRLVRTEDALRIDHFGSDGQPRGPSVTWEAAADAIARPLAVSGGVLLAWLDGDSALVAHWDASASPPVVRGEVTGLSHRVVLGSPSSSSDEILLLSEESDGRLAMVRLDRTGAASDATPAHFTTRIGEESAFIHGPLSAQVDRDGNVLLAGSVSADAGTFVTAGRHRPTGDRITGSFTRVSDAIVLASAVAGGQIGSAQEGQAYAWLYRSADLHSARAGISLSYPDVTSGSSTLHVPSRLGSSPSAGIARTDCGYLILLHTGDEAGELARVIVSAHR